MRVLLDIKDNKAAYVMELLESFSFVKTTRIGNEKAQLIEEINEAVEELKEIKAGKKTARNEEDFIGELL